MSRRALPTLRQSQLTTIDFIKPNFRKYLVQREKKSEISENIWNQILIESDLKIFWNWNLDYKISNL